MRREVVILTAWAIFMLLGFSAVAQSESPKYYRINRTQPQSIRVGNRMCAAGDTINEIDTIFLEAGQYIEVYPIPNTNFKAILITKNKVLFKTQSQYSNLKGMYAKGKDDYYVMLENQDLILDHIVDTSYQYRIRINHNTPNKFFTKNGNLVLKWSLFENYSGEINVYIDRKKDNSRVGIEEIYEFKIDLIKITNL